MAVLPDPPAEEAGSDSAGWSGLCLTLKASGAGDSVHLGSDTLSMVLHPVALRGIGQIRKNVLDHLLRHI